MNNRKLRWHIVTGEYPPQPGGVSDYTRQVARGLVEAGDEVTVWAPEAAGHLPYDGIALRRLPGCFGLRALWQLTTTLRSERRPFRLLVQYLPHLYGYRAMNLAFCVWLASMRRYRPWVMFHEVAVAVALRQRWTRNVLGVVTHLMAALVAGSADRCFISVPRWAGMLRRVGRQRPSEWLPIPSNVATTVDLPAAAAVRAQLEPRGLLLGHFGTFGTLVVAELLPALTEVLTRHSDWSAVLVGRGSEEFAAKLTEARPDFARRVHAVAGLTPDAIAAHLAACDLLIQPFSDGASSRRTSLMAGLALGLPIVTTQGLSTEPLWEREALVVLASVGRSAALVEAVEKLAQDAEGRHRLGERARNAYRQYFSLQHTLSTLRS